ncbi:MAG: nucleotidyltransferase family protein [Thermodesulfobacteriota bacterium]|nr:nucleotidyltransferase family protein [Thermodesulfobacteriota bacterium]
MDRNQEKIAGLLLAAGASTRMGRPKQLLAAEGVTLLERVLGEVLKSDLDKVVLVLGHQAEEIKEVIGRFLEDPKLSVIENRHYKKGISSSIIAGLSIVKKSHDHVMILLADMPHIDANLINLLLDRYLDSGFPIGAVEVEQKRSHPVIFNRNLYPELLKLQGDTGARGLFQKYDKSVCLIEPDRFYDDRDIDTPEDYTEFQKALQDS